MAIKKVKKKVTKKSKKKPVLKTPIHQKLGKKGVIPGALPTEVLGNFTVKHLNEEAQKIIDYVEWQAPKEKVKHLEKVSSESIFGKPLDSWDVRTNKTRWWVITNPTNLYSQDLFPSLDYTISFHVGVTTRMEQAHMTSQQLEVHDSVNVLWNKMSYIHERMFEARKPEDFQAVGMKCRECLLQLIKEIAKPEMVPAGTESPQKGNFIQWAELAAQHVYSGGSKEKPRAFLKDISKGTWQLVNWLTHSQNAEQNDAILAVNATEQVLFCYITAFAKDQGGKLQR